jgi:predicted dehydrogenase
VTLRVAVWGLGSHARRNILPALQACDGVALRGVCSRDATVVAQAVADLGCASWDDPVQMLADPAVDVVCLATPIGLHAAQGAAVLDAGRHLWCEKPLAQTLDEAMSLVQLSRVRGVSLAEGFMYLYHPQFRQLRDLLQSPTIGVVHQLTCRFGIPPLKRPGFRMQPELGGGAFLDVGSYPISLAAALFPGQEPEVQFAEIETAPGSPVDTAGRAVLRCDDRVSVSLEWGVGLGYRNEIDVWGSEGSLMAERVFSKPADFVPQIRLLDRHGNARLEEGRAGNHFVAMFAAFRDLAGTPDRAEDERLQIARRARLGDRIRQRSIR